MRGTGRAVLLLALAGFTVSCFTPPETAPDLALNSTYAGSAAEFDGEGVLLVAAWADWAPIWKLLAPELRAFQERAPEGVEFQYLNVDENRELVRSLGVEIIPSIVIIRRRSTVTVLPNLTTADALDQEVTKWLGG